MLSIDFQGLLNVLHASELNPDLRMDYWSCGTARCMIGSFCNMYPEDRLFLTAGCYARHDRFPTIEDPDPDGYQLKCEAAIAQRFGITQEEAKYLFMGRPYPHFHADATYLSKDRALTRLRKFIYYKLHKQEMTLEAARRIGGNRAATRAMEKVCV